MNTKNDSFLEAATEIGIQLCREALWDGMRCNWLGDTMEIVGQAWTVVHRACGPDLYGGTSGIGLFLARLYAVTGDRLFRVTAEGALRHTLSRLEAFGPKLQVGFYGGLTGIAYALLSVGELLDSPVFADHGLGIAESFTDLDATGQGLDVVSGAAGAVPALLSLQRKIGGDALLELAVRLGEHLLRSASKAEIGWSWRTLDMPTRHDLTGFSHGVAGIAWALLELYRVTHEKRFSESAEEGFRYEGHWFNPEQENWPDFRPSPDPTADDSTPPSYPVAWCHGAPGIGLSRLRAYEILGDPRYREQAEIAVRTTIRAIDQPAYAGYTNYCLCHGLGGNAELLLYASRVLGQAEHLAVADQVGRQGIATYQEPGAPWPCGVIGGGETPSLMLGLAGIGHFYLRLYDPSNTPPVVILLPEPTSSTSLATSGD